MSVVWLLVWSNPVHGEPGWPWRDGFQACLRGQHGRSIDTNRDVHGRSDRHTPLKKKTEGELHSDTKDCWFYAGGGQARKYIGLFCSNFILILALLFLFYSYFSIIFCISGDIISILAGNWHIFFDFGCVVFGNSHVFNKVCTIAHVWGVCTFSCARPLSGFVEKMSVELWDEWYQLDAKSAPMSPKVTPIHPTFTCFYLVFVPDADSWCCFSVS